MPGPVPELRRLNPAGASSPGHQELQCQIHEPEYGKPGQAGESEE